jgi:hypothetical protein
MENNFYRTVNINEDWVPRLTPYVNWESITAENTPKIGKPPFEKHLTNIPEVVPEYINQRLRDVGLEFRSARVFSWAGAHKHVWHIDGRRFVEQTAINFVLFGSGQMQWSNNINIDRKLHYENWGGTKHSNADEVIAETGGHSIFVNIGIPHRVVTQDDGRVTLSLLWKEKCNYPFSEMLVRLSDAGFIDKE